MIYLDTITEKDARGRECITGAHMVADTLAELHAFAQLVGLKREWFQDHPRHPHYDLTTARARRRAIGTAKRQGVHLLEVDTRLLVRLVKRAQMPRWEREREILGEW